MDIYTGDIIAMYSSPSYDPNKFLFGISNDDWSLIRNNPLKPLVNKTLAGLYSPGSTIKPIVALSALENKIVSPSFKVKCTGKMELYGQTFHCWKEKGHGFVSLKNAMKQSCDTYFYEVARLLGVDRLNVTAEKFGLGKKVLGDYFDFEKSGLFPNTKWKKNNLGKGWVLGETLITGIGQGYTQTTPLQLCLMTAQIANAIETVLEPRGVAVYIEAQHQCMTTRGVKKADVSMVTTSFTGVFKTDDALRNRFFSQIQMPR